MSANPTRDRWRAAGRCLACGGETGGYAYCAKHREARVEARRAHAVHRFPPGARVRVWRWGPSPDGNPPDLARLPGAATTGHVAAVPSAQSPFYAVDFPPPFGRLHVLEGELEGA